MRKRRVLFICEENDSACQMAEAIVNARLGGLWEAVSAGKQPPRQVRPEVRETLAEKGIHCNDNTRDIRSLRPRQIDLVIAFCDGSLEECPEWLQQIYGLHPSITTDGGFISTLQTLAHYTPFIAGFILGAMIGMEIPLIARVREQIHGQHLMHNTGTIYGADYIGAGIGAAIWVAVWLHIPIMAAAVGTATINLIIGLVFLWRYQGEILRPTRLWVTHAGLAVLLVVLGLNGNDWVLQLNYALFKDTPVYSRVTPYQHLTLTQRKVGQGLPSVLSLYINGRLQFSSNDENIYHSYLVYPALLASARHDEVLVIGGGDGMAVLTFFAGILGG